VNNYDDIPQLVTSIVAATEEAADADYTEALDDAIGIVQAFEREMYLRQQGPDGTPWKPLALPTVMAKGFSAILVETGRMFESLTTPNGTEDTIWITGKNWLTFGTEVPYAKFHQTGTRRMPARPHVGIDQPTADRIGQRMADAVAQHIGDQINA
jgi:phage gpG-like protein